MGLVKANFRTRGTAREQQPEPDLRDEFERQVLANGARGSFMVFQRAKKEDTPLIASGLE